VTIGKTKAIVGTMFAGKTTLLQNLYTSYDRVEKFYPVAFKPKRNTRDKKGKIVSHDNNYIHATEVELGWDIVYEYVQCKQLKDLGEDIKFIVFIDEAQFFEEELLMVIEYLNSKGADVICSGLNLDRFGKPFGIMPSIMAVADEVVYLKAICSCGNEAYVSYGKNVSSGEQVAVGGKEEYEPLCKTCFYNLQT
jgi:thymidine kinase